MADSKPLSDEKIAAIIGGRVGACSQFTETRLSQERAKIAAYYDASEPRPLHKGSSKYISQDVFDSVEMAKALLVETFTGNDRPVRFLPIGLDDVRAAGIATEYVNYVIHSQNRGYEVFHDAIHDGLTNRAGVSQLLWREDREEIEETLKNATMESAGLLFQQMEARGHSITPTEMEQNEDGVTMNITYTRTVDRSQVVLEAVPPEEFGMSPRAKSVQTAGTTYRRTQMTRSELRKQGYDKETVDDLSDDASHWEMQNTEVLQRFNDVDDGSDDDLESREASEERITVFTVYTRLDVKGDGVSSLYKVIYAGGKVLDKERCSRAPFLVYSPIRKPHSAWGSSYAKRIIATQNARTMLTRAVIDHALITTNPRHVVVRGGLVNPKELLENRLGGVVNVTRPDAVAALQNSPLNPFVMSTIKLLDEDSEKNTGVSRLSQGLNKDAISKQNSTDSLNTMVAASQQRQKIMARNFAYGYLSDLYLLTYQLVLENEKSSKIIEIAGDWVPVDPQDWEARNSVAVEFHLGSDEKAKEYTDLVNMDAFFSTQPGLAMQYGPEQRYALLMRAAAMKGIRDLPTFLLPPDQAKPQPPNKFLEKEWELKEREVAVKEHLAGVTGKKAEGEMQRKMAETALKAEREANAAEDKRGKLTIGASNAHLKRDAFEHQTAVDQADLMIREQDSNTRAYAYHHPHTPGAP